MILQNDIEIIKNIGEDQIDSLGVRSWNTWEKEVSEFDWYYDTSEKCFFIEGEVELVFDGGSVTFGKGDFVTFPQGLKCKWIIHKAVLKHYLFE